MPQRWVDVSESPSSTPPWCLCSCSGDNLDLLPGPSSPGPPARGRHALPTSTAAQRASTSSGSWCHVSQAVLTGWVGGQEEMRLIGVDVIKLAKEFPSGQAALQEGKTLHTMAWQGHVPSPCQLLPDHNTTRGKEGENTEVQRGFDIQLDATTAHLQGVVQESSENLQVARNCLDLDASILCKMQITQPCTCACF